MSAEQGEDSTAPAQAPAEVEESNDDTPQASEEVEESNDGTGVTEEEGVVDAAEAPVPVSEDDDEEEKEGETANEEVEDPSAEVGAEACEDAIPIATQNSDVSGTEEEEFISSQTFQRENSIFKALQAGFQSLADGRDSSKIPLFAAEPTEDPDEAKHNEDARGDDELSAIVDSVTAMHKKVSNHVSVNFIDPTTRPAGASVAAPKSSNMMSRVAFSSSAGPSPQVENVYEKLTYIFQRDYGSTLRGVQYKNMRNGESDVISSIPIHTILARTGTASGNGEADVAWGGLAGTASAAPVSDPSEWHNGPFCHVYIAACENMDHYRTKVRPSLQAFVSQIEASSAPVSAGNAAAQSLMGGPTSTAMAQSGSSAHYLIVFVPNGGASGGKEGGAIEDASPGTGTMRRAFASQFAKARERITTFNQTDNSRDLDVSRHSHDSFASGDGDLFDDDPEAAATAASLQLLSQSERKLYKKMQRDFQSGKICILSRASLDGGTTDEDDDNGMNDIVVRTQEWNSFNRMLGAVIVNGFRDRCRRYNDELRRLDTQRAAAAQAAKISQSVSAATNRPKSPSSSGSNSFNLGYLFLVKESLAFTYEQMQLPGEALLQYDEFRAFLPDLNPQEHQEALKRRHKSKSKSSKKDEEADISSLMELADAGDFMGFRRRIRSEFDLNPILDIMRRYLFAREISLLFKMEQPVELVTRCERFSKLMYSIMLRGIDQFSEEEQREQKTEACKWVIQFSWDVKITSETYLRSIAEMNRESFGDNISVSTPSDRMSVTSVNTQSDHNLASRLGDFLETSRLLYKKLGDTILPGGNPLRVYESKFPDDMFKPWAPWIPPDVDDNDLGGRAKAPQFVKERKSGNRDFLLEGAFESLEKYEEVYLDLAGAIVNLSKYGRRRRLASRLQGEMAEHLVRKGDLLGASVVIKATVKKYRVDQWDRCHFWRLFRLAYCQRTTAKPSDYLKTLATCFSPRTGAVAPKKALEALQADLEAVVAHPMIGEAKYGTIAFLETTMEVQETSSAEESTMGRSFDRKQLLKRYCSVGECMKVDVSVMNYLPKEIDLDSLKLFIVDFETFSSIIENRESVEEEDAVKIIGLDSGVKLQPGRNTFTFEWEPSSAGQYILSTLEVVWKEGFFYYDSMELPESLLGIDVLPSEPSHSISFDPGYLVPGHDQEIRITFDAGSDLVTAGILELECSDGIGLIGPGEDPMEGQWKQECEIELEECKPGEKAVFKTHVRCGVIEAFSNDSITQMASFDTAHGLTAKAVTTYLHARAEGSDNTTTPHMKANVEAFAPILEKTALSVESVHPIWLVPNERVMISINLLSNTPDHFAVEDWSLFLPSPLHVDGTINHNSDWLNCEVSDGDNLALAFECTVTEKDAELVQGAKLQVKLRDDNGKIFTLDLQLDLDEFYQSLVEVKDPLSRNEAKACLTMSVEEGRVGQPITLTFTVETQAEGDVVYSISPEGSDWLIAGKVNGSMKRSGFMSLGFMGSCEIIGIPAVAGVLKSFPTIQVGTASLNGGYTPMKVTFVAPAPFKSLTRTGEVGVAFPNKAAV